MFFDLTSYKIRILKPHTTINTPGGLKLPIDVPGTVLGLETKNANIIQNYINKNRLLEVLCDKDRINRGRAEVFIRWDNDQKLWHYANEEFMLLSSNYPILRSIWYNNRTAILRDFRPAHERIPVTMKKKRRRLLTKKELTLGEITDKAKLFDLTIKNNDLDMPQEANMTKIELPPEAEYVALEVGTSLTNSTSNWETYTTNWYSTSN